MTELSSFWAGKQVLITGAGGFIGSHLVQVLVQNGARVRAFVRYNSRADPGLLSLIDRDTLTQVEIIAGDLRDLPALQSAVEDMEIVFHLGALIAIPYSYLHPAEVVETNVIGTLNMLLACREHKVARLVHTSTSEVYGTALRVPIDEGHPLQGQSPYSASKIGADKLAESFYRAYDLPVVTVRPFNTFGPRQSNRAVIPTIITQALRESTISLGNLETSRDFTYVADTVYGFLCAGQAPGVEGGTFNLGTGKDIRIREVVAEVASILNKPITVATDTSRLRPVKSEVQRLISDNRLAFQCLGWAPQVSLSEGLSHTIQWISEHMHMYQPQRYQL
jgi:NAD dependent epimerase/dehydratase